MASNKSKSRKPSVPAMPRTSEADAATLDRVARNAAARERVEAEAASPPSSDLPATEPPPPTTGELISADTMRRFAARAARADAARARRLARAGCNGDRCWLLGVELDAGPRARPSRAPVRLDERWVSAIAADLLTAGVTAEDLTHAAARLGEDA